MKVKICPMCQHENKENAVLCKKCFAAIRSIKCTDTESACNIQNIAEDKAIKNVKAVVPSFFASKGFSFGGNDVTSIMSEILKSEYLIPQYEQTVSKIRLLYKPDDLTVNAHAWWGDDVDFDSITDPVLEKELWDKKVQDIEHENEPYVCVLEGLVSMVIPVAAMYIRGLRGAELIHWIRGFSSGKIIFDGNVPEDARALGKAMLAEVIAHEIAHIIKKHSQISLRAGALSDDKQSELNRALEYDADITAYLIIEKTEYRTAFYFGALLNALVFYVNPYQQFADDEDHPSHPSNLARLNVLLSQCLDELIAAGINRDELNAYANLAGVSLI